MHLAQYIWLIVNLTRSGGGVGGGPRVEADSAVRRFCWVICAAPFLMRYVAVRRLDKHE